MKIRLRETHENDLGFIYEIQKDPEANHLAAFTAKDPNNWEDFMNHWDKILREDKIIKKTITLNHDIVGSILCFPQSGLWEVTYWIDKQHWGKGITSHALSELLKTVSIRPLHGRTAKDNVGSQQVLEKNGFLITGEDRGYANARGEEVEEFIYTLYD